MQTQNLLIQPHVFLKECFFHCFGGKKKVLAGPVFTSFLTYDPSPSIMKYKSKLPSFGWINMSELLHCFILVKVLNAHMQIK